MVKTPTSTTKNEDNAAIVSGLEAAKEVLGADPDTPDDGEQEEMNAGEKKEKEKLLKYGVLQHRTIIDGKLLKEHHVVDLSEERANSSRSHGIPLIGPLDAAGVEEWNERYKNVHGFSQEDADKPKKNA